ncbi:Type-1 fimbrial protein, A chain precursor [compost metagenome]
MGAAIILPAQAADGTITFNGSITATTCTVTVNGVNASATVNLPAARLSDLGVSGNTAGATDFNVVLSNCTGLPATGQGAAVHFESGSQVNTDGRLNPTRAGSGVELAIYPRNNATPLMLGQAPLTAIGNIAGGAITLPYTVKYRSISTTPTAGAVSSSVTYSIVYF